MNCLSSSCSMFHLRALSFLFVVTECVLTTPPQIWDLKTYKIKVDLPGHTDEVYCVDFVADKIVSGGRDKVVKMYVSYSCLLGPN